MGGESDWFGSSSNMASIKTYMKCNNFLKQMLQELEIEPVPTSGGPKSTNIALVQQIKSLLNSLDKNKIVELSDILDPEKKSPDYQDSDKTRIRLSEQLDNMLEHPEKFDDLSGTQGLMIDDISPNAFKQSLAAVLEKHLDASDIDIVSAREVFRRVLDDLQSRNVVRRKINVVASNFPRMYGYLLEAYEDEIGISAYGRGKNLKTAKIRIG